MRPMNLVAGCCVAVVLMTATAVYGWDGLGHYRATEAAVIALPQDVPAFFRNSPAEISSGSMDPDVFKLDSLPQLRKGEYPEHYFDLEPLKGTAAPATRYDFVQLCAKEGLSPDKVGTLPYALAEWTQRLTVAFAQYRQWPDDPAIQHKCLVYAGILAHYAEDACQPLHTTIDYDGRTGPDGKSPRSGIHAKVDALIEKVDMNPKTVAAGLKVEPFDALWPAILRQLQHSYALVDDTYELEKEFPGRNQPLARDSKAAAFGKDRLQATSQFTAAMYLTAWRDSAKLEVPAWHVREHKAAASSTAQTQRTQREH
jgi:hypothetical protein